MSERRSRRVRSSEKESSNSATLEIKTQPGSVYVEKGTTVNLGDYNSYRLSLGMNLPINYTKEDLENARKAIRVCANEIQKEMDKILLDDEIID